MIKIYVSDSHVQITQPIKADEEMYVDSADFTDALDAVEAVNLLRAVLVASNTQYEIVQGEWDD